MQTTYNSSLRIYKRFLGRKSKPAFRFGAKYLWAMT